MTGNILSLLLLEPLQMPSSYRDMSFYYYDTLVRPINGSSQTGHCEGAWQLFHGVSCSNVATSVLFDGIIPTLTGLDGDMWANQLLTLNTAIVLSAIDGRDEINARIGFVVAPSPIVMLLSLELILFNCPEWGIATTSFRL